MVEIEVGEAADRRDQRIDVGRGLAAEAGEKLCDLQLGDHRARIVRRDRQQPERDVLDQLDQDAAGADHQHRTVERIGARADDHLDAVDHLLHEIAVDRRARHGLGGGRGKLVRRALDLGLRCQMQPHAADLGLVRDRGRDDLQRHRKADLGRGRRGVLR